VLDHLSLSTQPLCIIYPHIFSFLLPRFLHLIPRSAWGVLLSPIPLVLVLPSTMTVMPTPPFLLSQYYHRDSLFLMSHQYNSNQSMPVHPQDQQHLSHSMQPPPSPPIPIDPALALYPPSYYPYQAQQHPQVSQQLSLVAGLSSPSSQASDAMSTPPAEQIAFSGSNKRPPSSSTLDNDNDNNKRRKEDDSTNPSIDGGEHKAKPTRGSRSVETVALLPRILSLRLSELVPFVGASK
jgi:hypothetical protein